MEKSIAHPRVVNAGETAWGDHPRFAGVKMKALLTRADNALANVSLVQVPLGSEVGWHAHLTQVETIFVQHGHAVLTIGDTDCELLPGCIVAIPIGARHRLRNAGEEPVELLATFTPPND
jgi:mannose-6-phosphate isomerase-like protein (cupin superfamily)